eukprot:jgi/Mesvir1/3574/Mv12037-RA.1
MLQTKTEFAIEDVQRVAVTALDILLVCPDIFYQVRWGSVLARILRSFRFKLTGRLTIDWRPLYRLLQDAQLARQGGGYQGQALLQVHVATLTMVIRRARRFFPPGSAQEIADHFWASMRDPGDGGVFEEAGYLSLLVPTQPPHACAAPPGGAAPCWPAWVSAWLAQWDWVSLSTYWDARYLALLSRAIKHLPPGTVDWEAHLPALFTHILQCLQVPVGKSSASPPATQSAPKDVQQLFGAGSAGMLARHAAKCVVYLLRPGGATQGHLDTLVEFLEQFYHPSNGGAWTNALEQLLKHLAGYFVKRLAWEARDAAWLPSSGLPDEQVAARRRQMLGEAERRAFVATLMRLVERAQFSKSGSLAETAAAAAGSLARVAPDLVLSLVLGRFRSAIETQTATHQLGAAVETLSLCVRPLLAAGEVCVRDEGGGEPGEGAREEGNGGMVAAALDLLAAALMETLPGIDANDPSKTLATLQLYCVVLSNVHVPQGDGEGDGGVDREGDTAMLGCDDGGGDDALSRLLPLPWEEWVDGVLTRVLLLLNNVEAPHDVLSHCTYLMNGSSQFRSFVELLFARLPPKLFTLAARHVAKALASSVIPGAASEAGMLCGAAVYARPQQAMGELMAPILAKLEELLAHVGDESLLAPRHPTATAGASGRRALPVPLSHALESSLVFYLEVCSVAFSFAGASWLGLAPVATRCLSRALLAPSHKVVTAAGWWLSTLLKSLALYYPTDYYRPLGLLRCGAESFLSGKREREGGASLRPRWHTPSEAERALASSLLEQFVYPALGELEALCGAGEGADASTEDAARGSINKDYLRSLLVRMDAALGGVGSCVPDFAEEGGASSEGEGEYETVSVVGSVGVVVGVPGLRSRVAAVLCTVCDYFLSQRADDTGCMALLLQGVDGCLNYGTEEYITWAHGQGAPVDGSGTPPPPDCKPVRYRPRWILVERACLHAQWRASQAAYAASAPLRVPKGAAASRPGARPLPRPPPPPPVVALADRLLSLAMHRYKAVRVAALTPLERCLKRYPALLATAVPRLMAALTTQGEGEEGKAAGEEAATGACAALSLRIVMRHLTQTWRSLAAFLSAMVSASHHAGLKAQVALNEAFVVFCLRFSTVPLVDAIASGAREGAGGAVTAGRSEGGTGSPTPSIHWRYAVRANCFLWMLLQPALLASAAGGARGCQQLPLMASHYLANLRSELSHLRLLSLLALLSLLSVVGAGGSSGTEDRAKHAADTHQGGGAMPSFRRPSQLLASGALRSALASALLEQLGSEGVSSALLRSLSLDHHVDGSGRGGSRSRSRGDSGSPSFQDEALIRAMSSAALAACRWPRRRPRESGSAAVSATSGFSLLHAQLFEALLELCGPPLLPLLRAPIEAAAAAVDDRASQCVAAEAIGGLLRSRWVLAAQPHGAGQQDAREDARAGAASPPAAASASPHVLPSCAWVTWLRPLLLRSLQAAPAENVGEWAACVRFGAGSSGAAASSPLALELLALFADPSSSGGAATSVQQARRLMALGACLSEIPPPACGPVPCAAMSLSQTAYDGLAGDDLAHKCALWEQVVQQLQGLMASGSRLVREEVACCLGLALGSPMQHKCVDDTARLLGEQRTLAPHAQAARTADAATVDPLGDASVRVCASVRTACYHLAELAGPAADEVLRQSQHVGGGSNNGDGGSGGVEAGRSTGDGGDAGGAQAVVSRIPLAGVVAADDVGVGSPSAASAGGRVSRAHVPQVAWLESALLLLIDVVKKGYGGHLAGELVAAMLPHVLGVQETFDADLSVVAKHALVYLKYQPLPSAVLPSVVAALEAASALPDTVREVGADARGDNWPARAASLNFLQSFSYRHVYQLDVAGLLPRVRSVVLALLRDPQLEVRELASATLSGFFKSAGDAFRTQAREDFTAQAAAAGKSARGTRRHARSAAHGGSGKPVVERHAPLLGLAACVLAYPYDVPRWLPDTLMVLAAAAGEPPPVGDSVTRTLAEFRRTHADTWTVAKRSFSEEQLEVLSGLTLSSSYFV